MTIVDLVDSRLSNWPGKVELLHKGVILLNVLGGLDPDVQLCPALAVGDVVPEVLELVYPGEKCATQQEAGQLPWLAEEGHELGLAL